jgi:hypothetical protein
VTDFTVSVVKTSVSMTGSNKASIILPNATSTVSTPNMASVGTGMCRILFFKVTDFTVFKHIFIFILTISDYQVIKT